MNKHLRLLALALIPLTLGACETNKTTSESSSVSSITFSVVESSSTTSSSETTTSITSSSSSLVPTSTSSSSTTSAEPISSSSSSSATSTYDPNVVKNVEIDQLYETHYWDATIKDMIQRAIGDSSSKFPEFVAPSYDALLKYDESIGKDVLVIEVACYGVNPNSCIRLYKEKMEQYGYTLSSLGNYGYQMVDYTTDLFLNFEICDSDSNPYFLISAFKLVSREKEWATEFVNLYADMVIPACEAPCYNTSYDSSKDTLTVFALFVDKSTALNSYATKLCKNGFTVQSTDQYGVTTLIDDSGYLTVQLYLTYGDYDCDALYINFVNIWPTVGIASFIGAQGFPKLNSYTAIYDGYTYIDPVGQGKEEDYTLCIYYKNASSTDFGGYVSQLTNVGMSKGEMITYSDNDTYAVPMTYVGGGMSIKVNVMYRASMNMICVVIYQAIIIK